MRIAAALGLIGAILALGTSGASAQPRTNTPTPLTVQRLWTQSISPAADSSGAYLAHPRGSRTPLVYVLAGNNSSNCNAGNPVRKATLYALDAARGTVRWTRSTTGPSRCTTAGPVVDRQGTWVYAPGLDGKMHRYNALSGQEYRKGSWPKTITLMPDVEKMAATATINGRYLYVTTSGFIGDQGHYEGHLVSINLSNGAVHVFNSLCSNVRALLGPTRGRSNYCPYVMSGLFGRGQGVTDPVNGAVYVVSGNGPWNGKTNWGDSILKLNPSGTKLLDSYTPANQKALEDSDADLGSTGPALLPPVRSGGRTYHLLVQGGKGPACDGCNGTALRLLNRDNLSGKGGPGNIGGDLQTVNAPGGCEVLTAPAVRKIGGTIWVFYANDCGTAGYRLTSPSAGTFRLERAWLSRTGGTTPVFGRGALFVAHDSGITAFNPSNGSVVWQGGIGSVHWEYPLVAKNRMFVTDHDGKVYAYRIR